MAKPKCQPSDHDHPYLCWDDCNKRYICQRCPSPFLSLHPPGGFLLEVAGEDATQEFEAAIHSESARIKSNEFLIGKIDKNKKQGLSLPTSFNPQNNIQNNKPPSKYPPSNNNNSSTQSESKQIKFTNMNNDILLLYGTQKGTCKHFTEILYN
eukprot:742977_1